MFRISLMLLLGLCASVAGAQKGPIPIYTSDKVPTPFISSKGNLVFELPAGHRPVLEYPQTTHIISIGDQQPLEAFDRGVCPVRRQDGSHYLINAKGENVKELGNIFTRVSPAINGYLMGWQPYEGRKNASWLLYLTAEGENAFGDRRFWEAAPFSEGYAAVQLQDEKGDWGYIDASGEIKIRPQLEGIFRMGSFHNGLALVTTNHKTAQSKFNFKYYFINTKGEVVIDVKELMPDKKLHSVKEFSDGFALISWSRPKDRFKDVTFIDSKGMVALSYESVENYSDFVQGRASLTQATPTDRRSFTTNPFLIDKTGKRIALQVPSGEGKVWNVSRFDGQYFLASLVKEDKLINALFDGNGKMVFKTHSTISGRTDQKLLVKKNDSHSQLLTLKGKLVWETAVKDRKFTNLQQALPNKDQVRYYECQNASDLEKGLLTFKNLETLSITHLSLARLPEGLGELHQLRALKLEYMDKLTQLPASLHQLQQLERLEISDCKNLKGLESLIEQLPNLKVVYLVNHSLVPGFQERMKKLRPQLVFDGFSTEMMEIIEMDVVIEE